MPEQQNRPLRRAYERLRDAAEQEPLGAAPSVRTDHDDVGVAFFGCARQYLGHAFTVRIDRARFPADARFPEQRIRLVEYARGSV